MPIGEEDESQCGPGALAQIDAKYTRISVMVVESRGFWEQVRARCVSDLDNRTGLFRVGKGPGSIGQHTGSQRYGDIKYDSSPKRHRFPGLTKTSGER